MARIASRYGTQGSRRGRGNAEQRGRLKRDAYQVGSRQTRGGYQRHPAAVRVRRRRKVMLAPAQRRVHSCGDLGPASTSDRIANGIPGHSPRTCLTDHMHPRGHVVCYASSECRFDLHELLRQPGSGVFLRDAVHARRSDPSPGGDGPQWPSQLRRYGQLEATPVSADAGSGPASGGAIRNGHSTGDCRSHVFVRELVAMMQHARDYTGESEGPRRVCSRGRVAEEFSRAAPCAGASVNDRSPARRGTLVVWLDGSLARLQSGFVRRLPPSSRKSRSRNDGN